MNQEQMTDIGEFLQRRLVLYSWEKAFKKIDVDPKTAMWGLKTVKEEPKE